MLSVNEQITLAARGRTAVRLIRREGTWILSLGQTAPDDLDDLLPVATVILTDDAAADLRTALPTRAR